MECEDRARVIVFFGMLVWVSVAFGIWQHDVNAGIFAFSLLTLLTIAWAITVNKLTRVT